MADDKTAELRKRLETREGVQGVADELERLRTTITDAIAVHVPKEYWAGDDPFTVDMENTPPAGALCLTCSNDDAEDLLDNWEFDSALSGYVEYPCETVRVLSRALPGVAS